MEAGENIKIQQLKQQEMFDAEIIVLYCTLIFLSWQNQRTCNKI